jgi:mono/diheme cytochrome c family protein
MSKVLAVLSLVSILLVVAGCGNMAEQPKLTTYSDSPTFGRAARDILPEAVAVDHYDGADEHLYTGQVDGEYVDTFPFEVTDEVLELGQSRYDSFCTPCHGYDGSGEGVVALEGYPQPASHHTEYLRNVPHGYIFDVIENGIQDEETGEQLMYAYGSRVEPVERWAIIAYMRAMQYSRYAPVSELPDELRAEFSLEE